MSGKVWESFCEENPEYADPKSPERKIGDEIYRQKYEGRVIAGTIDVRAALDATHEEVVRQKAFQDVQSRRRDPAGNPVGSGVKAALPQFGRTQEDPARGGTSAGRNGRYFAG